MIIRNKLTPKALKAIQGSLRSFTYPLRNRAYQHKNIVACVFSTGERTEAQSIESVKRQSLPVTRIEIIKNVTPMHEAFNRMFEVAKDADYILCVDADMILHRNCTRRLLSLARPDTLYCLGTLLDPVLGKVGYIKLLNMDIVQRLGIKFQNVHGCDVDFNNQAANLDPSIQVETYTLTRRIRGIHRPTYTAKEIFRKNQIEKKKRGNIISCRLVLRMSWLYLKSGNPVLLAGILGEIMSNPDISSGEVNPESGLLAWDKARCILGDIPEDLTFGFPDIKRGFFPSIKHLFELFKLTRA